MRPSRPALAFVLGVLLALLAAGCSAVPRPAPPPPAPPAPFVVTFWCGPPPAQFDDARAAQIAAAGFTVVGAPCEGDNSQTQILHALDVAARHGLALLIGDPRISLDAAGQHGWETSLDAAVATYRNHPGLAGYFLTDEPSADEFAALARLVARLRADDPAHLAYVNLPPDFVSPADLNAKDYWDYLQRFLDTVPLQWLSYDYYPFLQHGDRKTFFTNLWTIRDAAQARGLPFLLIVQTMPHGPYREPTEAELAWQVFHALAFGARGISYFAYWTPVHVRDAQRLQFHSGLIEHGVPTLHYFEAAELNHMVRAVARQLARYRWLAVADSTGEIGIPFPLGPITALSGGQVTVGVFTRAGGGVAALLVNRDYRRAATVELRLRAGARVPEVFDAGIGRWRPAAGLALRLAPGMARLLRWR